ncbi:hypothetical protein NM688_g1301 [Phlebia brevispora]|uniref:Uncharacterized protein n=1 Tax=Phlebia brevispora TaxID=194682 RepID=A0ACC1TC78_9APHY|nr:hypothetical protein NM688_g1301 [Phlebia brevispora]
MRSDPHRRFAYGFTAEDANMTLWYCDRSQILLSSRFSFIKDYRFVLHFVLAVSFAELHQLGWDPTMSIVNGEFDSVQYNIPTTMRRSSWAVARAYEMRSTNPTAHASDLVAFIETGDKYNGDVV